MQMVRASGGLEYAETKMRELHQQALEKLHRWPDNPARQSLEQLSHYVIERQK
jgi:octaprenyl-diphosphate synthase